MLAGTDSTKQAANYQGVSPTDENMWKNEPTEEEHQPLQNREGQVYLVFDLLPEEFKLKEFFQLENIDTKSGTIGRNLLPQGGSRLWAAPDTN
jgi:hypothetical protein